MDRGTDDSVRKAIAVTLFVLAALALVGALTGLARLSYTPSGVVPQPNEFIPLLVGTTLLCGLGAFWLLGGIQLLKAPRGRGGPFLRGYAWLVLVVGCLLWLGAAVGPIALITSPAISLACVLSAVVVLSYDRDVPGDAK